MQGILAGLVIHWCREYWQVGELAKRLVAQWKRLVMAYSPPREEQREVSVLERTGLASKHQAEDRERTGLASQHQAEDRDRTRLASQSKGGQEPGAKRWEGGQLTVPKKEILPKPEPTPTKSSPRHVDDFPELSPVINDHWDAEDWEDPLPRGQDIEQDQNLGLDEELWNSRNEPSMPSDPPEPRVTSVKSLASPEARVTSVKSPGPRAETLVNKRLGALKSREASPVTPLPDYVAMLSPQLKAELARSAQCTQQNGRIFGVVINGIAQSTLLSVKFRFGLKAVPRRKAALLLNHIYEQTHPLLPATPCSRPPSPAASSRYR